ncbi:hypothetical protein H6G08_21915 [Calothrix anomala FACHB-343]|uniref:Uncharacterized protein n=1 Tax=Calothrix anomala FACHB-343 TaxID=2692894 RepID=A0ABR8AY85_9CYAN|nr:hypothetical protein [Calothrix anomala FACHB-343]
MHNGSKGVKFNFALRSHFSKLSTCDRIPYYSYKSDRFGTLDIEYLC